MNANERKAVRALLAYVTSGRRYESRNPYTIPEVIAAIHAIGETIVSFDASATDADASDERTKGKAES